MYYLTLVLNRALRKVFLLVEERFWFGSFVCLIFFAAIAVEEISALIVTQVQLFLLLAGVLIFTPIFSLNLPFWLSLLAPAIFFVRLPIFLQLWQQ